MSGLLHNMILTQKLYIHKTPCGAIFPLTRDEALSLQALGWQGIEIATIGDEEYISEQCEWIKYIDDRKGC